MPRPIQEIDDGLAAIQALFEGAREVPALPAVADPNDADQLLLRHSGTQSSSITAQDFRRYAAGTRVVARASGFTVDAPADFLTFFDVDASAGPVPVTLPAPTPAIDRFTVVVGKNEVDDSGNPISVTVAGAADPITELTLAGSWVRYICDGTRWVAYPNTLGALTSEDVWARRSILALAWSARAGELDSAPWVIDGVALPFDDPIDVDPASVNANVGGGRLRNQIPIQASSADRWTAGPMTFTNDDIAWTGTGAGYIDESFAGDFWIEFTIANTSGIISIGVFDDAQLGGFTLTHPYGTTFFVASKESWWADADSSSPELYYRTTNASSFPLVQGDAWRLERVGSVFTWLRNGAVHHTYTQQSTATVRFGCGSQTGDMINNVRWSSGGGALAAMDFISPAVDLTGEVSAARVLIELAADNAISPAAVTYSASIDGGATWEAITPAPLIASPAGGQILEGEVAFSTPATGPLQLRVEADDSAIASIEAMGAWVG